MYAELFIMCEREIHLGANMNGVKEQRHCGAFVSFHSKVRYVIIPLKLSNKNNADQAVKTIRWSKGTFLAITLVLFLLSKSCKASDSIASFYKWWKKSEDVKLWGEK